MKKVLKAVLSVTVIVSVLPLLSLAQNKNIYGTNDNLEYFQLSDYAKQMTDSTVSLWKSKYVIKNGEVFDLATANLGEGLNLCPDSIYRDQISGSFCSGTLVGDDIVMTAGHCITDEARCSDTKFVFGFRINEAGGAAVTTVPANQVYGCKKIIKRDHSEPGLFFGPRPDYALVQLDRKVADHKPLAIDRDQRLSEGAPLFVIGYPMGMPVKVAGGAHVRSTDRYFFTSDLDIFEGHSGSAVFNGTTGLIEGIAVRAGDPPYITGPGGCKYLSKYGQYDGNGVDSTNISVLARYIPVIKAVEASKAVLEVRSMKVDESGPKPDLSKFNIKF